MVIFENVAPGKADLRRQIIAFTLISVAVSVALTSLMIFLCVGVNCATVLSVGALWRVGLSIAVSAPLLICPALTFQGARVMVDLGRSRADLVRAASQDPLTGLLNRRGFEPAALQAIARAGDERRPVAALICDIDKFKSINDDHGHEFGDRALILVAEMLRSRFREPPALLCRQGGEEFVVLLPGADEREALSAAEDVRAACAAHVFVGAAGEARMTLSIGVAAEPAERADPRALLLRADAALYRAKREGRNRVVAAAAEPAFAATA
jgi:diguanylate cyclase (GGDEF)-like protein